MSAHWRTLSGVYAVAGGRRSDFRHGYMTYDGATRQTAVVITDE
jgi:hypothetical protein